ncbi:MAG: hypothetical protein J7K94_04160 [Dehalococcoidia bacterium]|nr:hypothetical protein [Dehalococcoidia bacterium]
MGRLSARLYGRYSFLKEVGGWMLDAALAGITSTGGEDCDRRGICWSTSHDPDVNDSKAEKTGSFGTGSFTASMAGAVFRGNVLCQGLCPQFRRI